MRQIPSMRAKVAELCEFCDIRGLDYGDKTHPAQLRSLIARSGWTKDYIELEDEEQPQAVPAAPQVAKKAAPPDDPYADLRVDPRNPFPGKAPGDTVRLLIQEQDPKHYPGGDQPVFVCPAPTRERYIPRGVPMDLPYEHACVLAHAKTITYDTNEREGLKNAREIQTYPFQVLG